MAYQREVRLGLVLYGGVSLAVYENGIAQEFYRAIRGEGVYGLIAKLIDSDIVVDIISGTSAGGVNGIMLAYALANKRQFAPSAELWRNEGDIQRLMRSEDDPNPSSILDSSYYQDRLQSCFDTGLAPDPTAPAIGELDLFVTSTDANGAVSTVYDDLGHAIDIKNHRALFKLAYRGERKNDLNAPPAELAKLSRMTSCFPVAFEPVRVTADEPHYFRWGKLRSPAVYLDGGLLNNKPFTSTIDAIASRTTSREVERFLIYVEPNPEQFAPSPATPASPSLAQAGIKSLISIPGYQSIANDLAAIEAHNQRAGQIEEIVDSLPDAPERTADCLETAGVILAGDDPCNSAAYEVARLIQVRDAAVEAILDDGHGRAYFPAKEATGRTAPVEQVQGGSDDRRSGRILVQSFNAWSGEGNDTLVEYDVFFRMRRVGHLSKMLMRQVKAETVVPDQVWETVNHYFKCYEIAKASMMRWLRLYDFGWQRLSSQYPDLDIQPKQQKNETLTSISAAIWGQAKTRLDELMRAGVPVPTDTTPSARETFYQQLQAAPSGLTGDAPAETSLLHEIDQGLKQALLTLGGSGDSDTARIATSLRDEFCRFLEVDRRLFLVQLGSEFESTELIRVVRFSPLDAQRGLSRGPVQNKVRGLTLGAFGGFFKKSWRANDIMVGRLDAACLMVECLLTKERLAALAQKTSSQTLAVTPDELQGTFPRLSAADAGSLSRLINAYLQAPNAPERGQWDTMIDAIVSAAHNEIHAEEYPTVVACAIEQEHDWGRYQLAPDTAVPLAENVPYQRETLKWYGATTRPDQVLIAVAADAIAQGRVPPFAVSPFAPGSRQAGTFLEEIPDSVLQELASLAAIRLGKGLLASVPNPKAQKRLKKSLFYRLPFNWVAPILYRYGLSRRTQPDTVVIWNTVIPTVCLTALTLAILLPIDGLRRAIIAIVAFCIIGVWGAWFRR